MAIREGKFAAVEISDSEPTTIESVLLQDLEELDPQEQRVLCEFLQRIKRNRAVKGQIDELAVVVNGLKDYPTEDEWLSLVKINEKPRQICTKNSSGQKRSNWRRNFLPSLSLFRK